MDLSIRLFLLLILVAACVPLAGAQSASNVRTASVEGQVFVVWDFDTMNPPETYEIYAAPFPMTDTGQGTRVGRLFKPEWTGERLQVIAGALSNPSSTYEIPTPVGRYRLAADEALFVATPTQSAALYFAVVPYGATAVTSLNRSGLTNIAFDPNSQPVRPQLQLSGTSPEGYPYKIYASWSLGLQNSGAGRPDYPVMANANKNGSPNLYCIYEPMSGLGAGSYPCVFGLHGGEGNFQFWRPGLYPAIGLEVPSGIMVAPTDSLVYKNGATVSTEVTRWFGYSNNFDPFSGNVINQEPPAGSILMDYTCRRFDWFLSWLLGPTSPYSVDPNRVSLIGQSMGGRGVNIQMRYRPSRFASVSMLTPVINGVTDVPNTLFGSESLNMPTNLTVFGQTVRMQDFMYWTAPLSEDLDYPFVRIYSGKNDATALWNSTRVEKYKEIDKLGLGWHLYWDSRVHGIASWANPPVGEFIAPVRTDLSSVAGQHRFRANQSFPAFYHVDTNLAIAGIQPDIGDGTTGNPGQVFGTWAGYCEWDAPIESRRTWRCDLYIRNSATASIDNWPGTGPFSCSVKARRLQTMKLRPGQAYTWTLRRLDTGALVKKGAGNADSLGHPTAHDIAVLPESTAKVRLEFQAIGSIR